MAQRMNTSLGTCVWFLDTHYRRGNLASASCPLTSTHTPPEIHAAPPHTINVIYTLKKVLISFLFPKLSALTLCPSVDRDTC